MNIGQKPFRFTCSDSTWIDSELGTSDPVQGEVVGKGYRELVERDDRKRSRQLSADYAAVIKSLRVPIVYRSRPQSDEPIVGDSDPAVEHCKSPIDMDSVDINIDDSIFADVLELQNLGMARLMVESKKRGLKCGGTLEQRAARLFAIRGKKQEDFPKSALAKS